MKILKIFGIFIFSILCITGITQRDLPGGESNLPFGIICGLIALLLFCSICRTNKKQKQKAIEQAALVAQQQALAEIKAQKLAAIDNLSLPTIKSPRLFLKKNEIAYIEQPAALLITQNKIVGTTGRSSGVSMRVAKGLYVRTGGNGGRKIYDDVTTAYNGILTITNQRVSFLQEQKSFEVQLSKLTNTSSNDDLLTLQHGNRSHVLQLEGADIAEKLIRKLLAKPCK